MGYMAYSKASSLALESGLNSVNPYAWMRYIPWGEFNNVKEPM